MENNAQLIAQCEARAKEWLSPAFDKETRDEVQAMLDNPDKGLLIDAFYRDLEFGTGGLRGIMGAGTNRMNKYIVGMATQGFANYILKAFPGKQCSVVVGHDCRNNGRMFAESVADIFSANGIKVYLFESLRPTPEISYAIRHLGCQAGVNVTASHNPREYNGYKAYWDDGAQVLAPHDVGIIAEVEKVKISDVKFEGNKELIIPIGGEMDWDYIQAVKEAMVDQDVILRQKDLNIVYSPMHGTGRVIIPMALRSWGFQNIHVVPEQMIIDGNFPTVVSPNPENAEAMTLGMKLGTKLNADLVIASDPDADRLAIVCRNSKGEWEILNGNQTCMMFSWYIIANKKKLGQLKGNEFLVKTIVTTEVIAEIAKKNQVEYKDCYTGFKWIATIMREMEGKGRYLGGGEESYGFLPETFARDKDSVSSIPLMCEIAAWAKDKGMTLNDLFIDLYIHYGYSKERGISVVRPGKSGADEIARMMVNFRENPQQTIDGSPVVLIKDFQKLEQRDMRTGEVTKLDMPVTSNVLQYFTEDGTKVSIRPSGTEPKIKFYIEVHDTLDKKENYDAKNEWADQKIDRICQSLGIA